MKSMQVKIEDLRGRHEICLAQQSGSVNKSLSMVIMVGKFKETVSYIIRKDRKQFAISSTLPHAVDHFNSI